MINMKTVLTFIGELQRSDLMLQRTKYFKTKFKVLAWHSRSDQFATHGKTKQKLVKKVVEDIKEKIISRLQNLWRVFTRLTGLFREKGWFTLQNRQKANASLQVSVSLQDTRQLWQRNSSVKPDFLLVWRIQSQNTISIATWEGKKRHWV